MQRTLSDKDEQNHNTINLQLGRPTIKFDQKKKSKHSTIRGGTVYYQKSSIGGDSLFSSKIKETTSSVEK